MPEIEIEYRAVAGAYKKLKSEKKSAISKKFSINLGGNCNTDFSVQPLKYFMLEEGFDAYVTSLPFGTWIGSALEGKPEADAWVIWLSTAGFTNGETCFPDVDVDIIAQAIRALISRGKIVVVILPEPGVAENDPLSIHRRWRFNAIYDLFRALPKAAVLLSVEPIQFRLGRARWQSTKYWTLAKCPCLPDAVVAVANEVSIALTRILSPRVKVIAVDLDNTLWGGVVGDDGPENLKLDPHAEGRPFLEMQRFLKDLKNRGLPLCVVSKNDPEEAARPFVERSEMILKREDFVMFEASWDSKAFALRKIAKTLNVGLDSICFIDDSRHERGEMRAVIPALLVPDLPEDPELRVSSLIASRLFSNANISDEDQLRTKSYEDDTRRASDEAIYQSRSEFLENLNSKLLIERISPATLVRCASLAHKTNQFNLTYRRSSVNDLSILAADSRQYAYCFRLNDKYGDAGLIAVLVARRKGSNELHIDEWLMSCRVFNRGVEHAVAEHLLTWCLHNGILEIQAERSVQTKNAIVVDVLEAHGFLKISEDKGMQVFRTRQITRVPHFIRLENRT